jgi:hypothetical protein
VRVIYPGTSILGALLFAVFIAPLAHGQLRNATPDEQIVREAQLVASGARVDLFQHGLVVDPGLVEVAERALTRMEELLGQRLDESTLGPRIRIYVAAGTAVSHVWRGYEHRSDPKAMLFLNPKVAQLALTGANATYAHELAHLLTWRYYSHTLREGLADYLALQIIRALESDLISPVMLPRLPYRRRSSSTLAQRVQFQMRSEAKSSFAAPTTMQAIGSCVS